MKVRGPGLQGFGESRFADTDLRDALVQYLI